MVYTRNLHKVCIMVPKNDCAVLGTKLTMYSRNEQTYQKYEIIIIELDKDINLWFYICDVNTWTYASHWVYSCYFIWCIISACQQVPLSSGRGSVSLVLVGMCCRKLESGPIIPYIYIHLFAKWSNFGPNFDKNYRIFLRFFINLSLFGSNFGGILKHLPILLSNSM